MAEEGERAQSAVSASARATPALPPFASPIPHSRPNPCLVVAVTAVLLSCARWLDRRISPCADCVLLLTVPSSSSSSATLRRFSATHSHTPKQQNNVTSGTKRINTTHSRENDGREASAEQSEARRVSNAAPSRCAVGARSAVHCCRRAFSLPSSSHKKHAFHWRFETHAFADSSDACGGTAAALPCRRRFTLRLPPEFGSRALSSLSSTHFLFSECSLLSPLLFFPSSPSSSS